MTHEINEELSALTANLASMGDKYPQLAREAAEARLLYDLAWADGISAVTHEFEKQEKKFTVPERDALVTKKVAQEMGRCRRAEAELDIAKKYIANIESRLSATQTKVKLLSIEAGLS